MIRPFGLEWRSRFFRNGEWHLFSRYYSAEDRNMHLTNRLCSRIAYWPDGTIAWRAVDYKDGAWHVVAAKG